jgi:hypothetical protein
MYPLFFSKTRNWRRNCGLSRKRSIAGNDGKECRWCLLPENSRSTMSRRCPGGLRSLRRSGGSDSPYPPLCVALRLLHMGVATAPVCSSFSSTDLTVDPRIDVYCTLATGTSNTTTTEDSQLCRCSPFGSAPHVMLAGRFRATVNHKHFLMRRRSTTSHDNLRRVPIMLVCQYPVGKAVIKIRQDVPKRDPVSLH